MPFLVLSQHQHTTYDKDASSSATGAAEEEPNWVGSGRASRRGRGGWVVGLVVRGHQEIQSQTNYSLLLLHNIISTRGHHLYKTGKEEDEDWTHHTKKQMVGVLSKSSATYKKKETFCVSKSAEPAIFHFPSTTILKQTYDTATAPATVSGLLSEQPKYLKASFQHILRYITPLNKDWHFSNTSHFRWIK